MQINESQIGGAGSKREDTLTTNDNSTFKSANISAFMASSNSSVPEEALKPTQGNIILSKLEEIEENSEDQDNNSEEDKFLEQEVPKSKKSSSPTESSVLEVENSPSFSNMEDMSINKFDATINSEKPNSKRIKLPKLLVLVSKYPIYKDMEKFLKRIKLNLTEFTNVPFESMILNLVYEFPHPCEKYIIQSKFWNLKRKAVYEFELSNSLPY